MGSSAFSPSLCNMSPEPSAAARIKTDDPLPALLGDVPVSPGRQGFAPARRRPWHLAGPGGLCGPGTRLWRCARRSHQDGAEIGEHHSGLLLPILLPPSAPRAAAIATWSGAGLQAVSVILHD